MKGFIWLIVFLLAVVGAAAIADYAGVDVPMIEVSMENGDAE